MKLPEYLVVLTNAIFGVVEFMLATRIVLKLFGAHNAAPFVRWVYESTQPLLAPFQGAFPASPISGNFVIEFSALFALIVYALAGYLVVELITRVHRHNDEHAMEKPSKV